MKLEQLFSGLNSQEIKTLATEKSTEIRKEVKKFVKGLKKFDLSSITALADNAVVESLRDNLNMAIDRVQDLEVMEYAKGKVADTKNTVLSVLNVPSQVEVDNLTRKMVALEKKVKAMGRHTGKSKS